MKKSLQIVFAIAALLMGLSQKAWTQVASDGLNYYWAVSSGNWNDKTSWKVGASWESSLPAENPPNATNNVFFGNAPFERDILDNRGRVITSGSRTVTISTAAQAKSIDWTGADTDATGMATPPTFQINNSLTISGSLTFITNMTVATSGGSVTFNSTEQVNITSANKIFDMPVTFNGTGGRWILQDNMTINQSATFVNGYVVALPLSIASDPSKYNDLLPPTETNVTVASPRFIFTTTSATVFARAEGASHASHVIGYVQKSNVDKNTLPMPNNFVFPIGDGTYYRPISIYDPSNSIGDYTARYLSTNPFKPEWRSVTINAPLNSVSNKEFWYLVGTGSANTNYSLNYNHPLQLVRDYYHVAKWTGFTIAGLSVSSSGNASWSDMGGVPNGPATATIPSAAGTSSSAAWFTIGRRGHTGLPVRLVSFTAQQLNGQVQLKWQSSSEENTSHFEVERSADGRNFTKILIKAAQGNSTSLVSYSVIDNNPLGGTSYYRLNMVDLDGTSEHSNMVTVRTEGDQVQVRAYPNPSKGSSVHLAAEDGQQLVLMHVTDLFGKQLGYQVSNVSADGVCVTFSQPLPAGFYLATLAPADEKSHTVKVKFVVQ